MTTKLYLVFDKYGFVGAKKTHNFNLRAGERAASLTMTIPDEAFSPDPLLRFNADVPIEMVLRPAVDVACEPGEPISVEADQ